MRNKIFNSHNLNTAALFLSLTLCACETSLLTKPGSDALRAGDAIVMGSGNLDDAEAAYKEALDSPNPAIHGQAAYNLAMIARERGRNELPYLEQAAATGHVSAKTDLMEAYKTTNPPRLADVERLSLSLAETSAAANLNLLEMAHKKHDAPRARLYAAHAEKILLQQISEGDTEGKKSLILARLYTLYGSYFDAPRNPEPYYRAAMIDGNVKAAKELAEYWKTQNRSAEDIFAVMIQAAEAGDNAAIKYVSSAYEEGLGVPQDIDKAMSWGEKVQGRIKTGTLLRLAHASMETDPEKAKTLFAKAAAQGSADAKIMLYGLNAPGASENPKDYAGENPESLFSIIKKLEKTYGKTHPDMIRRQYMLAASAGSGKAIIRLAETSAQGSDEQKKWYAKSANTGNGKAILRIARDYKIGGDGKAINEKEAFRWFEKAAKAGEPEGQYETGLAYARGAGVEKDREKARMWLEKAQAGGYTLAVEVLKNIDSDNSGEPKP